MKTKDLTLCSIFIALGIVLPMATHSIAAGPVLLPMHIPVIISGFILKPRYAVIVGVLTPILSSVLTGMPPVFPVLPMMVFELGTYAIVTSILVHKFDLNVWIVLILSMIAGRIAALLVTIILIQFFDAQMGNAFISIINSIKAGTIGILIQLTLIPAIVYAIRRYK